MDLEIKYLNLAEESKLQDSRFLVISKSIDDRIPCEHCHVALNAVTRFNTYTEKRIDVFAEEDRREEVEELARKLGFMSTPTLNYEGLVVIGEMTEDHYLYILQELSKGDLDDLAKQAIQG